MGEQEYARVSAEADAVGGRDGHVEPKDAMTPGRHLVMAMVGLVVLVVLMMMMLLLLILLLVALLQAALQNVHQTDYRALMRPVALDADAVVS